MDFLKICSKLIYYAIKIIYYVSLDMNCDLFLTKRCIKASFQLMPNEEQQYKNTMVTLDNFTRGSDDITFI